MRASVGWCAFVCALALAASSRVAASAAAAAASAAACKSAADCNLNGACVRGACVCASFWGGASCGAVRFGAAAAANAGALLATPSTSHWCAGVVHDNATGLWHAYSAQMGEHCGLDAWQRNSIITHAAAGAAGAGPAGPYGDEALLLPAFAHNPKPVRAPDGSWLIFHIGCGSNTTDPISTCTNGTTPIGALDGAPPRSSRDAAPPAPGNCSDYGTSVLVGSSPSGPFTNVFLPIIGAAPPAWLKSADNPTVLFPFAGNETCWVMFRSYNHSGKYRSVIGIARAPSWRGPFVVDPEPALFNLEDPFIWWQPETSSFHALFHTMGGCADVGCHGYSADGVSWTLSATPAYGYGVELDDGSSMTLKRRERPQLVFDPASGRPTHLINGAEPPQKRGGQEDFTYSIIVPLPYAA